MSKTQPVTEHFQLFLPLLLPTDLMQGGGCGAEETGGGGGAGGTRRATLRRAPHLGFHALWSLS